jgi:hypothetical protein
MAITKSDCCQLVLLTGPTPADSARPTAASVEACGGAQITRFWPLAPGQGNCWHGNYDPAGVSSSPANLQQTNGNCATAGPGASVADRLFGQVLCNLHQLSPSDPLCNGAVYPTQYPSFSLMPLPPQPSLPDPCSLLPRTIP